MGPEAPDPERMTPKRALGVISKGFCMGAADVVPGVSGGTMALILGIYQRLLEAIRSFDLALLGKVSRGQLAASARHVDLAFLLLLLTGIFTALMFFTRVVGLPGLVQTKPELVFGLFFGLITASIVVLLKSLQALRASDIIALALGAVAGLLIVSLVPFSTPETPGFIVLTGALAISALILPGISGSFVLLILRKYAFIFDALGRLDLHVIVPFAIGAVAGLVVFSRILVWLLHHFYQRTLVFIIGVLCGSLWIIWPFQNRTYEIVRHKSRLVASTPLWPHSLDAAALAALALMVLGFGLVLGITALASRQGSKPD